MDNYYGHNTKEEEQYQFYSTYRQFTLQDYDTLLKKSQDTTREIQLSEEEKKNLNMADWGGWPSSKWTSLLLFS